MKTKFCTAVLLAFVLAAAHVEAANNPAPAHPLPPGMGRYILVLKLPGERRDSPKTITEPDVAKLGGTIIHKHDNRRVIDLPTAAAKVLRADDNVAYLQRVWMGESFDTWDERDQHGSSALKARPDDVPGDDLTWNSGTYAYDPSGNIKAIGSDAYAYDTASRLVKAVVNSQTETYGYDSFGNLTAKTLAGQSSTVPPIDSTSNRISGETYDAAGNVTTNGSKTSYMFDSVGSLTEVDAPSGARRRMIYTADDERIGALHDPLLARWTIRDVNGSQVVREFQSEGQAYGDTWEWVEDYVYAGNVPVGGEAVTYWGGRRHLHLDHLGSVRMITSDARLRYSRDDFYPFGAEQTSSVQENTNFGFYRADPKKFTGHQRDYYGYNNVDGNDYIDYMHARYYNPNMGRFLSVDPLLGKFDRPQSWNRYAYVENQPTRFIDPTGRRMGPMTCKGDQCQVTIFIDDPIFTGKSAFASWHDFFQWYMSLENPVTGMTEREHLRVTGHALEAFADGVIPDVPFCDSCDEWTDPFEGAGAYDVNEPGMRSAQVIGATTRDVEVAIISAGATMETKAGAEGGNWVTNNAFRWGKGSWKGSGGPQWHFHLGPGKAMVHHLPQQAITWRYHVLGILRALMR